ncbi:MAG TPA: hypothetical protein VMM38_00030 [Aridibacter sp.]|nr:hypothetical protein [Aridibacter sp.]
MNNIEKWSGDADGRNDTALAKENKMLKQKLQRYGSRAAKLKYDFKGLADKMYITTSKDGNLRIYSWDTQSGGTTRWFESIFQYRGNSGKSRVWSPASVEGDGCEPFYNQIFQMDATGG